jgi:hypothetical protein
MPNRHISPQSFDDILSDLGDDPAIPDPHGIRKSSTPKSMAQPTPIREKNISLGIFTELIKSSSSILLLVCISLLGGFIALLFLAYESLKTDAKLALEESENQVLALKKELSQFRYDLQDSEDHLYKAIDEIEVSIHSKAVETPLKKIPAPPKPDPHELELRHWRYLGMAQVGGIQQAFFWVSKARVALQLGSPVLGDWHLSEIQKTQVSLTHLKGKTLILKVSKIE